MKKLIIIILILFSASVVNGQEQELVVNAGITPYSQLFWSIDRALEKLEIRNAQTYEERNIIRLKHAAERIAEIEILVKKDRASFVNKANEEYEKTVNILVNETKGMNSEVKERVLFNLQKHVNRLEQVRLRINQQSSNGINKSFNGIDNALTRGKSNIEKFKSKK